MFGGIVLDLIDSCEIRRLDAVYHKLFYLDLGSEAQMPACMKDLSTIEVGIINCISLNPGMILGEIKKTLRLPNSTLTSAIDRLERRKLAERVISPRDRRSFGIRLTSEGEAVQAAHIEFEGRLWRSILSKLDTHEERDRFLGLAEKIVEAFIREGGSHAEN